MNQTLKIALFSLMALPLYSGNTDSVALTINANLITEIAVSSPTRSFTVNAAVAGQAPTTVTDTGSTISITTNEGTKKVTAELTTDSLPSNDSTLKLLLSGGTTTGTATFASQITMTNLTGAQDIITNLDEAVLSAATINYDLDVPVSVTPGTYNGSVVTFTVADQ